MDKETGAEDSGSCPFRPSPAEYAQALELGNSLALAPVALAAACVDSHPGQSDAGWIGLGWERRGK